MKILERLKNVDWARTMFLVPILLVAGISISHVVSWYDMANPLNWAIYLSIAIEVGAMTSLVAATKRIKGGIWFMFGLVTLIQIIGNMFYSYKEIEVGGDLFIQWIELTSPLFEMTGTEPTDIIAHKRWLALLTGGLLPLISLTSLHFYIKYEDDRSDSPKIDENPPKIDEKMEGDSPKVGSDSPKIKMKVKSISKLKPSSPPQDLIDSLELEDGDDEDDEDTIPEEESDDIDYTNGYVQKFGPDYTKSMNEVMEDIRNNQVDLDSEIQKDVNENFMDLVGDEPKGRPVSEMTKELVKNISKKVELPKVDDGIDDDNRRRVLSDNNGTKTLTYKKRRGGQSSVGRI